jgi:chromate transporter
MPIPSLTRLSGIYLRIGGTTFGGGDPTMLALHTELAKNRNWLTSEQYGLVFALARITPGTNLLAFCAGSAWVLRGWRAAVLAVAAVAVPTAVMVVLLTAGYQALLTNTLAMAAIAGTLAAAVGIMYTGAWQLLANHLISRDVRRIIRGVVIAGASLVLSFYFEVPPVQVLVMAAVAGFFWQVPARG